MRESGVNQIRVCVSGKEKRVARQPDGELRIKRAIFAAIPARLIPMAEQKQRGITTRPKNDDRRELIFRPGKYFSAQDAGQRRRI